MKKICSSMAVLFLSLVAEFAWAQNPQASNVTRSPAPANQAGASQCNICDTKRQELSYKIDARPGYTETTVKMDGSAVETQRGRFRKGDRVHLILTNMNPFLYEYTVKINSTPVAEVAPPLFFGQFSQLLSDALKSAGALSNSQLFRTMVRTERPSPVSINLETAPSLPKTCPMEQKMDAEEALKFLHEGFCQLYEMEKALQSDPEKITPGSFLNRYKEISGAFQDAETCYNTTLSKVSDQLILCDGLYSAIALYNQKMQALDTRMFERLAFDAENDALLKEAKKYEDLADEVLFLANEFEASYPECQPKQSGFKYLSALSRYAAGFKDKWKAEVQDPLKSMAHKKHNQFDPLRKAIDFVVEHQEVLLRQEMEIGKFSVPTDVAITVERKATDLVKAFKEAEAIAAVKRELKFDSDSLMTADLSPMTINSSQSVTRAAAENASQPAQSSSQADLNFGGGPRFSLSGGIVVSKLEKPDYQPVVGIARDRNGKPTAGDALVYIVGVKEAPSRRLSPVLMLNTRIWQNTRLGLHGSFGVTGKYDTAGTSIEYFFGPSLSFFENRLFLTIGPYVGKQQRLAGDLFQNSALLSDKAVPVRNEYHSKLGIGFTYKIK